MHTLDRYVLRQLAVVLAIVLLALTLLAWLTQVIALLDIVVEKGRSFGEFFGLTLLLIPFILGMTAPFAMFVASVFVLDRLNRDSELAVMAAAGLSRWRLLRPFALVGCVIMAIVAVINFYAQPLAMHTYRDMRGAISADLLSAFIEEGRFATPQAGIMVHVRAISPGGVLSGIIIEDARDRVTPVTYLASRAHLLDSGATPYLLLEDGSVVRGHAGDYKVDLVHFEQYSISLATLFEDPAAAGLKPSDMFVGELFEAGSAAGEDTRAHRRLRAEAHNRIASPLYVIVMILIVFVVMSEPHTTRRERVVTIIATTGIASAIRVGGFLAVSFSNREAAAIAWIYAIPIVAVAIATVVIIYQTGREPRGVYPPSPPLRRPARAWAR